ncbi:hypothetical protein SD77_3104 [Bacillus badius]|uniref:Uncharacterized protein n=1 Tax=Bacillus badius TaxID=1455 RepID=A0ABR5AWX6_BACBA|nr:hypothetical protein SD78_0298 [Bacillus badius]KIL79238.1 hypothetical protein SD77_3104 [Bacillus badius]
MSRYIVLFKESVCFFYFQNTFFTYLTTINRFIELSLLKNNLDN